MLKIDKKKQKIIIFSGGGTGGTVSPLLAVMDELKIIDPKISYAWIGTYGGIEIEMLKSQELEYYPIASGKLRRYLSFKNLTDLFNILKGFFQSLVILRKLDPCLVISAGGFVSVPVVWAARILGIPSMIHQQDIRPGLANRLMAPFVSKITVTFERSLKDYGRKAVWTGNPVRKEFLKETKSENTDFFKLDGHLPTVLVLGGGTGALAINELVYQALSELGGFCQVIQVTGKNKAVDLDRLNAQNYHQYEFLNIAGMAEAYSRSEIVVSRCGMGVLTELANLSKPAILIPIPDSHQEDNARIFQEAGAVTVLHQKGLTPEMLINEIKKLLLDPSKRSDYGRRMSNIILPGATRRIASQVIKIINKD